ncbi:hypothetical protein [Sodalis-like endosymbiont of Proechinophthirus fluctus]|uniref:hypothetical protein n=1 Tax=Sodalis-like endosymbiont of Proechinophthirus fluctus TaxID=1462730 RepID=UPI001FCBBED6|nr:hypothetical protein [Sodalis-like endosymbiont of Proechinophthirus fluctus]
MPSHISSSSIVKTVICQTLFLIVHSLLDILSESYIVSGEQVNITIFIQITGGHVTKPQLDRNNYSYAKAVYRLYQLVDTAQLKVVKNQLKLDIYSPAS